MRIECEVCSATYTIDDAQLGEQPVGAQCPYCGHVRLVRRSGASGGVRAGGAAAALGAGAGAGAGVVAAREETQNPGLFGMGITGAPPPAFGGAAGAGAGAGAGRSPSPGAFGVGSDAFGSEPAFSPSTDLGGLPPSFGAPPTSDDLAAAASSFDAGAAPGGKDFGSDFGQDMGDPPLDTSLGGGADMPESAQTTCQVCGTPLVDEFDKVIGLCDQHQRESRGAGDPEGGLMGNDADSLGEPASPGERPRSRPFAEPLGAPTWYVKTMEGTTEGPIPLDELRSRVRSGDFGSSDRFSSDGDAFRPMEAFKELAYLASLRASAPESGSRAAASYAPRRITGGRGRTIGVGLFAVALVGALGIAVMRRQDLARVAQSIGRSENNSALAMPNPLKRSIAMWRKEHQDASGTVHEHLKTAATRHIEDTTAGYKAAEAAYRRALLLDEDDVMAIAGYVENMALWRYDMASEEEIRTVNAAVRYAQSAAPDNGAAYRAQGALALAAGDLNGCRLGADRAVEKDRTDARAKLILAGCYLEGNVALAIQEGERARELMPDLRRSDRVLARAYAQVGRYAQAFQMLDERLKHDRDNPLVLLVYGDIERSLGEATRSGELYRKAASQKGDTFDANLALGALELEIGDLSAAFRDTRKAAEMDGLPPGRLASANAALARVELERRAAPSAMALAEKALEAEPKDVAALVVLGEAALLANEDDKAVDAAKRAVDLRPDEPAVLVLSARAALRRNQGPRAIEDLERAIANDPQDPRLKGVLAAVYLSRGGAPQAYSLMRKASEMDPRVAQSRKRFSRYALTSIPVRDALQQFQKSSSDERDAAVAIASGGLLLYHLHDVDAAKTALERALKVDAGNFTSLVYLGQIALDRNDGALALEYSKKLLAVERGAALGYLLQGRALSMLGRLEPAKEQLEAALRSDQSLTGARVDLARVALASGERKVGIDGLASALEFDPWRLDARRALREAGY
ncbi:MAG: zinc-ribbon domain-containing protein [Deltaproteobacteria bacterium]|nr:zinc-ribbon domain-containing protein [Deltaproteobacteria bacterium]